MPKHRVMRPPTVWFSVLVASLGLVVGGILFALTSPSAAADPEVPPEVTVMSRPDSGKTPLTNSGKGNSDHTPGLKSTETSRVPARSITGPTTDFGRGDGNNGDGNSDDGNSDDGNNANPGGGKEKEDGGKEDDALTTVPTAELPGIELPAITVRSLPVTDLPIPGMPAPNASTPPAPGSPSPGSPSPGYPSPSTGTPELTPDESEPAVPQGDPLSDPSTPPAATPTAATPTAPNCLMGAGTGGGCAGAEVARELSPAGLLVLGSVALFGSGAFLESLRNGRG